MFKKVLLAALVVASAVFAQNFKVGAHAAGSYGTASGSNTDLIEIGWGPGFNVGVDAKYSVNPSFSLIAGLGVDYRRIFWDYGAFMKKMLTPFMTSDYGYSSQYDALVSALFNGTATFSFLYVDIPVVARFAPAPNFFIDAGAYLGINVSASATAEVESVGYEYTEDLDSDMKKTMDFGLIAGLGYSVTDKIDIYFRAVFGLTNMIDMDKVGSHFTSSDDDDSSSSYGSYSSYEDEEDEGDSFVDFGFKNMRFQLGLTFWFM